VTADIVGWVIVVIISLVGWILTARNNGKVAAEAQHVAKEAAAAATTKLENLVANLPCIKDSTYEREMGALNQKVVDIEKRLQRVEK
jgi:formiminotetrahydrofolate cyclodeaminase